jgi:hypothetical protein
VALTALVFGYADRLDCGDFEAVARLFERSSYGVQGSPALEGYEAVLQALGATVIIYDDDTPRTKHVTTNLVLDISADGKTASAASYFTVLQATDGFPLQSIVAGRYADSFARDESGWYFTSRCVSIDLMGDISHHLGTSIA